MKTATDEFKDALQGYRKAFEGCVLEEYGKNTDPAQSFVICKPGTRMGSVTLVFTGRPIERRIVIMGDLCPRNNRGIVSAYGYSLGWFASKLSAGYLAEKFLETEYVPSDAYASVLDRALDLLDSNRVDWEGWSPEAGEEPPEIDDVVFHDLSGDDAERFKRLDKALHSAEVDVDSSPLRSSDDFYYFWVNTFGTPPDDNGLGYDPNDWALLVAIQEAFARLYAERHPAEVAA